MKTILETNTGKVLFAVVDNYELQEGQTAIDLLLTEEFVNPYYDFTTSSFYEGADSTEVNNLKIQKALEIDLYYTELISDLLRKHVEKKILRGVEIPQAVEDEVERLRAECNQKILELGVTSFSYRQSNLRL
jgi:hypothetical protein